MILEVPLPSRPSIAAALVTARPDVRPAVANTLFQVLRRIEHGLDDWRRNTIPVYAWQDGSGRPMISTTPPVKPPAGPRWHIAEEFILAVVPRSETRLGRDLGVKLHREAHDAVLRPLGPAERWHYVRALRHATCERPFVRAPDRGGWRRNFRDELITETVASVLEQLAVAANVAAS